MTSRERIVRFLTRTVPRREINSKSWIQRHVNDSYVKLASKNGKHLRSRGAFKLLEIQKAHKLISVGDYVIDLGASPGGWSIVASEILSANGFLTSVDLLPMEPVGIQNSIFIEGDFTDKVIQRKIKIAYKDKKPNVILSDMLMNTCGNGQVDHFRSMDLAKSVLAFADDFLSPGGSILCKILRGADDKELMLSFKTRFKKVRLIKPDSSRSESAEIYIIGTTKIVNKQAKNDTAHI
jgi:23S rRNA (uridine2552-2'-O)-methyltransferase